MEKIEFLDEHIKLLKKLGKPNDSNFIIIKPSTGKCIMAMMAGDVPKHTQKLSLYTFMRTYNNPEIIIVLNAWMAHQDVGEKINVMPSENPERKECFILHYCSKDKEAVHMLRYTSCKNKLIWDEETNYWEDNGTFSTTWNPYKFTADEIEELEQQLKIDVIKQKGKLKEHELLHGFKLKVWTTDDKFMFECINAKGECFLSSKIQPKTENDGENIKTIVEGLNGKNPEALSQLITMTKNNKK